MNLDELREVQRAERQTDSLQSLRDSFYRDAAAYVAERKAERDRAAEAADDPFSAPEVTRLTDEIETAEDVVESIYDRRIGKVVKRATFAAAGMSTDGDDGLTAEERDLFEDLVDRIAANRRDVLETVADAEAADTGTDEVTDSTAVAPDADDGPPGGDAAASDPDASTGTGPSTPDATGTDATPPDPDDLLTAAMGGDASGADTPTGAGASADDPRSDDDRATDGGTTDGDTDDRTTTGRATLRITDDVGAIVGVDAREYHLEPEDVVTLPTANAEPLVDDGTAERLD